MNEQNLRTPTSEEAKAMQKKSVEKRYENKIKRGLIASAILEELSDDDLHDIARGIIERSKENSNDLVAMRDTIGEKPVDKVEQVNFDAEYNQSVEYVRRLMEDDNE